MANKLSLNVAKTEFMVIRSRQQLATFDDHELCVTVNTESIKIKQVKSAKTLGLTLDENLMWFYQGFIEPYFSYRAPVWDSLVDTLSDRLQKLQNRAARIITHSPYDISSNLLFEQLK